MNIRQNPQRRNSLIWAGIIIIFIPFITNMDGFDGGFATACLFFSLH